MPRLVVLLVAAMLAACTPAPVPQVQQPADVTKESWYPETAARLAALNRDAEKLFGRGRFDQASAVITEGQPLQVRLLSAARPTAAALEAASDLDDLYGRMLLRNGHFEWARSIFQKNVVRWRTFKPQTPDALSRLKTAQSRVSECDRRLSE